MGTCLSPHVLPNPSGLCPYTYMGIEPSVLRCTPVLRDHSAGAKDKDELPSPAFASRVAH